MRVWRRTIGRFSIVAVFFSALWHFMPLVPVRAQAPEETVPADAPRPPVTYHGLVPGLTSAEEVREALGEPVSEAPWYAYKMLYPAARRPGPFDSVHLVKRGGHLACVEAASVPDGFEARDAITTKLGEPEYELRMATFTLLDYSAKGVRFVLDRAGRTIGVTYVPHLRMRVHSGARKLMDLSGLRQGPQRPPAKPAPVDGLKVGVAEAKLTPFAEWLDPKYRAEFQVHDDLWARCVVFEKDGLTLALVGADLFVMSAADIQPIRDRVAAEGVEHMVLAMSHNHAAPDMVGVYGHYPTEYVRYVQQQVAQCVLEAHRSLQPVRELRTASRELPMDGARVAGYFRNARNPGLVDPTISILQPIGTNGRPIATVVNFACHVEGLENGVREMSADFPGYMSDQIGVDGGGLAVFLNGAVGGMVSGDTAARTHEEARKMGLGLADIVKELSAVAQPPASFQFSVDTRRVEIPMTNERFKPLFDARRPLNRGRVVTEMALIRLGEAEMITVPGELLPEVSFEILEQMRGFPRMIVGLANDELGYIVPAYDFRDDAYEETMSVGPAAAPLIRDTALRLLGGVR